MNQSCAADLLRWKWHTMYASIHSLPLFLLSVSTIIISRATFDQEWPRSTHTCTSIIRHQRYVLTCIAVRGRVDYDVFASCWRGSGIHVTNETIDVWDKTSITSISEIHERSSQRSRICSTQGMSTGSSLSGVGLHDCNPRR